MSVAFHVIQASRAAEEAARKSLFERFRVSDATHLTRALTLNDLGIERTSALDQLLKKGVVREGAPGTFYLDEPTVAVLGRSEPARTKRTERVVIIFSLLLLLPIVYLVLARVLS